MKNLLLATIISISVTSAFAQDDIKEIQKEWGKEKKDLVQIGMGLSDAEAQKFWPIYDQYEMERQKIGRERINILNDYADNYSNLSNTKADDLINRIFKNDAALSKLQQQYYSKVKTSLNAIQAAKFLQIESYINATIKSALQEAIPVIGELDKIKTRSM